MVVLPTLSVTVHADNGKPLKDTVAVATAHVGWVINPTTGAAGLTRSTTASPEDGEVQPDEVNLTVNVYVPASKPAKSAVAVLPVMVAPPGLAVTVHADNGKPLKATVPVANAHVGCVIVPTTGADGVTGCAITTASPEDGEVQPDEVNLTVNL
jgi:hypothetical protein